MLEIKKKSILVFILSDMFGFRAAAYCLGMKERAPLSDCIVSDIRAKYPNIEGNYTGYTAKKK